MLAPNTPLIVLAVLSACLSPLLDGCSSKIKEEEVHTILAAVDKAAHNRNPEGVVAHMADDVIIRISMQVPFESKNFVFTRDQYKVQLQQGYDMAKAYEYGRKNTKIAIAPDGKSAKVDSQTFEAVAFQGGAARVEAQETAIFEIRNGKILITSVEATGRTELL